MGEAVKQPGWRIMSRVRNGSAARRRTGGAAKKYNQTAQDLLRPCGTGPDAFDNVVDLDNFRLAEIDP